MDFFIGVAFSAFSVILVVGTQRAASYGSLETNDYVFFTHWLSGRLSRASLHCGIHTLVVYFCVRFLTVYSLRS